MRRPKLDELKKIYRVEVFVNQTHEVIWMTVISKLRFVATCVVAVVLLLFGIYALIAFTPIRTTIPGYPDAYSKQKAIANAIKIDSLEIALTRWSLYSENLGRVLSGEQTMSLDSLVGKSNTNYLQEISAQEAARQDSILRAIIDNENQFEITNKSDKLPPIEGRLFYVPVKGAAMEKYDGLSHQAVDVAAAQGSIVSSVLDGTVVFAGWNEEYGYTIMIQHDGDIVSTYSHNRNLLKKVGDKVKAGTPIGLVGNTGTSTSESHLHFELWYKGESVDPSKYIDFK